MCFRGLIEGDRGEGIQEVRIEGVLCGYGSRPGLSEVRGFVMIVKYSSGLPKIIRVPIFTQS